MPNEDEMERTLRIEIPPCALNKEGLGWTLGTASQNGWLIQGNLNPYWTGTIDLAGYTRDHKTFYPSGAMIQEGPYYAEPGNDGSIVITLVSTVPLDADVLFAQIVGNSSPGFLDNAATSAVGPADQQNWETVMFAETDIRVLNSNITPNTDGICQVIESKQSGSLAATASDTLYVLKMVVGLENFATTTSISIPASRVVIPGMVGREPDVEYLMRLKRSVELANQV